MKNMFIFLLTCTTVVAAFCGENILKNPDFEIISTPNINERQKKIFEATEVPDNWGVNPAYPTKFTVITDAETSHSGSYYLRVEQLTKANSSCTQWWVPVKAKKTYRQSIWAKGKGKIILTAIPYTAKRIMLLRKGMPALVEVASDNWKEYAVEFTTDAETEFLIVSYHMQGVIDLDDPALVPIEK